jgi:tryptophan synthase alpha chain
MTQIAQTFERLRSEGKRGLIPFITAGDPDLATTRQLLIELDQAGADIIELGVPFSDPVADGPVIQRASMRALKNEVSVSDILQLVSETRDLIKAPVVLFSYLNPLLQFGLEELVTSATAAGVAGILVTDLSLEDTADFQKSLAENGIDLILLVAPTTCDDRLRMIAEKATGFIYAISTTGVTGARAEVSAEARELVARVRIFSQLPVAVGFGISTREQVADVWSYADAAVVGSAIVAEIERLEGDADLPRLIGEFTRSIQPFG